MLEIAKKALDHAAATGLIRRKLANNTRSTRIRGISAGSRGTGQFYGQWCRNPRFRGDTAGFAYTSDLSDSALAATARAASDNAAINAGDRFMGLPKPSEDFPRTGSVLGKAGRHTARQARSNW